VVKDATHPFIVTTSTFQLKVLGTAFNVRSYPNDKTSEAALVRGKIQIRLTKNPDKEITLLPSERLVIKNTVAVTPKIEKTNPQSVVQDIPLITLSNFHQSVHDTLPSEALWMENKLAFDAENFEEIANKMERWFSVHIEFKNNHAKQLRFTGEFKNESLYQTLASLQSTAQFHFTIKDNNVIIY
jgi:transmembrane sensor